MRSYCSLKPLLSRYPLNGYIQFLEEEENDGQSYFDICATKSKGSVWGLTAGKKGASLYEAIQEHQSLNIRSISSDRAEQVGYYRFLENGQVSISELVKSLEAHCQQQVEGMHVLVISDTSEINLEAHRGRLKPQGLGVVGNNKDLGFFIHPSLVLRAEDGFPLGLSAVQLWTRDLDHTDKKDRDYQKLGIEDKESYKWLLSAESSRFCLVSGGAKLVTHIGDRESDLYEEWVTVPDRYTHVLVRSYQNRRLMGQEESLYTYLSHQPCEGSYTVQIEGDPRRKQPKREALLNVHIARVQIQCPENLKGRDYPASRWLYAVEAKEVNPPHGVNPIHWRLLTTHEVVCLEQALQVIQWYCWRWRIEQLFGTLKSSGLDLEASQLESIEAIQRLCVLGLSVAVRTLQLLEGRDHPDLPAGLAFSQLEQDCLQQLALSLEGRTQKQRNPHHPGSLAWVTWIIARLGGWSGYQSQRPPGMYTLVQGLRRFDSIFWGWQLA